METIQNRIDEGLKWLETFGQSKRPPTRAELLQADIKAWEGRANTARREAGNRQREIKTVYESLDRLDLADISEQAGRLARLEAEFQLLQTIAVRSDQQAERARIDLASAQSMGDGYARLKARAGEIKIFLSDLSSRKQLTKDQQAVMDSLLSELQGIKREMAEKYGFTEWMSEQLAEGRRMAQEARAERRTRDSRFQ